MKFWFGQFFSSGKAHKLALHEVMVVCIISLVPLLALAVIDELRSKEANFEALFSSALGAGQLYLYSFSLLGTLFWLCQKEHENFARFEPRIFIMLFIFAPFVLILIIYSVNPTMTKPLSAGFVTTSYVVYALYVLVYYVLLVFDHLEPPAVEAGLQKAANSLINKYQSSEGA